MQKVILKTQAITPIRKMRQAFRRNVSAAGYSGNQAALRRLSRTARHMQFKLEIGAVNDPLEAEADRAADEVMRMPNPVVRRKCAECEEEDARKLQTKSNGQARIEGDAPPPRSISKQFRL